MITLSILGLYYKDNTIFANMNLPTQFQAAAKKNAIRDNILMECCELEIIYPDPTFMKEAIKQWSAIELPVWQRMADAMDAEYNLLWNVDATIEETENIDATKSGSNDRGIQTTGTDTTETTGASTDSSTAFNTGSMTARDMSEVRNEEQLTISELTADNSEWLEENEAENTRTTTRTGNIGVTSSQQLVTQELELAQNNIMRYIINSFKKRFCILVY